MLHTYNNYTTKKAFKAAALNKQADDYLEETSIFGKEVKSDCVISVAGPNEYHKWYAQVTVRDGVIVKVK